MKAKKHVVYRKGDLIPENAEILNINDVTSQMVNHGDELDGWTKSYYNVTETYIHALVPTDTDQVFSKAVKDLEDKVESLTATRERLLNQIEILEKRRSWLIFWKK